MYKQLNMDNEVDSIKRREYRERQRRIDAHEHNLAVLVRLNLFALGVAVGATGVCVIYRLLGH